MLVRTLGLTRFVNVDEVEIDIEPGDRILLCSDGLTEMVDDDRISKTLSAGTPDEVVWELVEMANNAGGVDNTTVAVVEALE
jgi:protein phosphatase